MASQEKSLHSVQNALRLLKALGEDPGESTALELSRRLDLGRATVYRLLETLESEGFVRRVYGTSGFGLGPAVAALGARLIGGVEVRSVARPHLESLAQGVEEAVHLVVLAEDRALFLDKVDSPRPVQMGSQVGWLGRLHATATGKCLLAFLDILKKTRLEPGKSNYGRAVMMGIPIAAAIGGVGTPAGSGINLMSISLLKETAGVELNFLQWSARPIAWPCRSGNSVPPSGWPRRCWAA